jgi:hypothetical protein
MKIIRKVEISEVLSSFDKEHQASDGTNSWARTMIENANHKFNGEWHLAELSRREVLRVLLVWHCDPEDGLELIPKEGMSVEEVTEHLRKIEDEYRKRNSDCYEKIKKFSKNNFSTLFLSIEPIKGYGVQQYDDLQYRKGSLVHLDGLHRLIAWALAGRLGFLDYLFSKEKINAFIAGPIK